MGEIGISTALSHLNHEHSVIISFIDIFLNFSREVWLCTFWCAGLAHLFSGLSLAIIFNIFYAIANGIFLTFEFLIACYYSIEVQLSFIYCSWILLSC